MAGAEGNSSACKYLLIEASVCPITCFRQKLDLLQRINLAQMTFSQSMICSPVSTEPSQLYMFLPNIDLVPTKQIVLLT